MATDITKIQKKPTFEEYLNFDVVKQVDKLIYKNSPETKAQVIARNGFPAKYLTDVASSVIALDLKIINSSKQITKIVNSKIVQDKFPPAYSYTINRDPRN